IFNPGYSTKINYETGEISRGLGLAIVKKIVEEELKGEIHVNSDIQYGTEISIAIKREELEV
ncbi:ATP-binding protein, partial [Vibrio parahaemolyticus]|nr:ATP-binding protein [Vibrio parahaemolyticus]